MNDFMLVVLAPLPCCNCLKGLVNAWAWSQVSTGPFSTAVIDIAHVSPAVHVYLSCLSQQSCLLLVQALSTCASAFANLGYYKSRFLDMAADFMARDPVSIGLQV